MTKPSTGVLPYPTLVFQKIKQNYQSIVLGVLVVLVAISVMVKLSSQTQKSVALKKTTPSAEKTTADKKTYTVKKGDSLWLIAENQYGSGFNALDIARTNKIKNPNFIGAGQKLTIPDVEVRKPTKGLIAQAKTAEITIKEDKYTIKKGDNLWQIALQAYGDGYQWVKIAKENKISDPNLIHVDNILNLPR